MLCYAYHAHSKMSYRHFLVFLRTSWITKCLALPTHAPHMHTTCTSIAHAYLHAIFLHFNQASYTLLHIWFIQHVWVKFLPIYDYVLSSWTNMDLIKFVFVFCGFAIGSLLCVYSFADVSPFLSWKRTSDWCSIISYFKTDPSFVQWFK